MSEIPFDYYNATDDELKNFTKGLMEGGFVVHKKLGNENDFNETIGKFGGVEVNKRLSDINIDFENPDEVERILRGFQDGSFEVTKQFTGSDDLGQVFGNIGSLEGLEYTKRISDIQLDWNNTDELMHFA
jgi:hypothetical protein